MTKRVCLSAVLPHVLLGVAGLWPLGAMAQATAPTTTPMTPPPVTPSEDIVSDEDFTAALPPIEDTVVPNASVETALPDVTTGDDAELSVPLPALAGYDVEPNAGATADVPQDQITYVTQVEGLREVGLQNRFKDLSALQAGKGKAVNSAMVRARATEDEALVLRLLRSEGYFDGTVVSSLTAARESAGEVVADITVTPGKPYSLGQITVDAKTTTPPDLIINNLPLKTGDQIVANQVLAAEANVSVVLPQRGYPFATVQGRDIALDPANLTGAYKVKVDTGNRSVFDGFRVEPVDGRKPPFDSGHVAVLTRFDHGQLYDSRLVDDLQQALIGTSLFRSVAVEPVATGQKDTDGNEYVQLVVVESAGPARTIAADAGYSTGEGFTAEATWTHRNLIPPEGALILRGALGTQEAALEATFRRSNAKKRDRTVSLSAAIERNTYATYGAYTASLSGSVSRVSTPLWQKLWTWSYGFEAVASRENSTDPITGLEVRNDYYYATLPAQVGFDRTDNLLNPATGYRLGLQAVPQISLNGASASNLRTVFDASYYRPAGAKFVLAARARFGVLAGGSLADIAPSKRLYAGGGGSVRGFAYQGLGPLDVNGDPTGGRSLFETSFEVRYRFGNYGIVPFIDVGQVYDRTFPSFSDLRVGMGVGARLYTNFGPIRIDIATPLDRRATEPQIALYVGIGQAF